MVRQQVGLVAVIGGLTIRLQPRAGEFLGDRNGRRACNGGRESSIPAFGLQVCRNGFLTPIPSRSRVSKPITIPVPSPTYFSFNFHHIFESHSLLQGQRLGPVDHTTTQLIESTYTIHFRLSGKRVVEFLVIVLI